MRNIPLIIAMGFVVIFLICSWNGFNILIKQDETTKNIGGNVESQHQLRLALIPNLVSAVKGTSHFEKTTLTYVINARTQATLIQEDAKFLTPEKMQELQQAQGEVSTSLEGSSLDPKIIRLQTHQRLLNLQTQLEGTENSIKTARNDLNVSVKNYNNKMRYFPVSLNTSKSDLKTNK